VDHLVRLVDDLVDVSRITRDRLELRRTRVEVASVVQQAVETCRPLAERGAQTIELALPERPVHLDADPVRLVQVVGNLLGNACKFSPRGETIRVAATPQDGEVVLSVKDGGVGIPPEKLESVFEMFVQLEAAAESTRLGLGIGLTLSRRLVELHGGTIEAHSEGVQRGSTFRVKVPLSPMASEDPTPNGPQPRGSLADLPLLDGIRVLVVDNEPDARGLVSAILENRGAEVTAVESAAEALEEIRKHRPDVLLSDIAMPGEDGYALIRKVRLAASAPLLPAAAVTAFATAGDRAEALDAGYQAHLAKPIEPSELTAVVAALARRAAIEN